MSSGQRHGVHQLTAEAIAELFCVVALGKAEHDHIRIVTAE
jgi:hypothetical protein